MDQVTAVAIHRGIASTEKEGTWIRRAKVRQLNGHDEQFLLDLPPNAPIHESTIKLLEMVVRFEGVEEKENRENLLRQLSIGDRMALLLHARRLTFGDTLSCVLACPVCRKDMSMDLSIAALLKANRPESRQYYELEVSGFSLKVRPLTSSDQDVLVEKMRTRDDDKTIIQELARSCIVHSNPPLPSGNLNDSMISAVSSKIEEIDPLSDILFNLTCPECNHGFQASLSVEDLIFQEINFLKNQLEREVHWLAFNYHWSESEILSLPIKKRKRYVELINATLAGENVNDYQRQ